MTRNTKEIALIQHRSGALAEMPKALHQAEIGLAKDANRVFIGNAVNTILANRNQFPYQNLEILTEYSNLKDYFKYSYENNITSAGTETDRAKLKEYLPIVITCENSFSGLTTNGTIKVNGQEVEFATGYTMYQVADAINAYSDTTNVYVTILQTSPSVYLTFVCLDAALVVEDVEGTVCSQIGFPTSVTYDITMPERKVTEKLDDTLHITDFGIKGDGTNVSQEVYNALIEVYRNYEDTQFYRNVMFPAGTYIYEPKVSSTSSTISTFAPFPIISNLHIHGEGIDRTVFKTGTNIDTGYVLLNCVDNELNPATNSNYGKNSYPANVLIEDVTFESTLATLGQIKAGSNITFNRVKFKGSTDTKLLQILGDDNTFASSITFNECIFEGGSVGLLFETNVKNVTITNCLFKNVNTYGIKIGDNSYLLSSPCKGFNLNGNIFEGTPITTGANTCALFIGKNTDYISVHQSSFENTLFNNWLSNTYPIPYIAYKSDNNHNFIDTLDPNTDTKKVLKFHFSQPTWEYLNYLINSSGKVVLTVDGNDSDITASNGINIKESSTSLDIRSVKSGDVKLTMANNGDLVLGEGITDGTAVTGNIQVKKTIQLNDNKITNNINNGGDIKLETATNKVIREVQPTGSTAYEQLVLGDDSAIPNVAYVNMYGTKAYEKIITSADLANFADGVLPLIDFTTSTYGSNIHLERILLNVRTPFYKVFEFKNDAINYDTGLTFYKGDVVKSNTSGTDKYGVVTQTHVATGQSIDPNQYVTVITGDSTLKSVKYVDVFGTTGGTDYDLTHTYYEDYTDESNGKLAHVNIQANNKFGYDDCETFVDGITITGDDNKIFNYCDRNYVVPPGEEYALADLHDAGRVLRKYDEGYNYVFEMDRNYNNGTSTVINPSTLNFANGQLKLKFYDEDGNIITSFTDRGQLNPGGELLIRIEYNRLKV